MKLSLPPKLVEILVWVPVILFSKILLPVTHLMAYYAETGHSHPLYRLTLGITLSLSWLHQGFLISILWHSHTGDRPQEELAKFGYMLEGKVEKLKNLAIFWWHVGTYLSKYVTISEKKFSEICWLWHKKNHKKSF